MSNVSIMLSVDETEVIVKALVQLMQCYDSHHGRYAKELGEILEEVDKAKVYEVLNSLSECLAPQEESRIEAAKELLGIGGAERSTELKLLGRRSKQKIEEPVKLTWEDIKDIDISTIGYYWQAGIGTGVVESNRIWFVYVGKPNEDMSYFTGAVITEQEYFDFRKEYRRFIYNVRGEASKQAPDYVIKEIKEYILKSDQPIVGSKTKFAHHKLEVVKQMLREELIGDEDKHVYIRLLIRNDGETLHLVNCMKDEYYEDQVAKTIRMYAEKVSKLVLDCTLPEKCDDMFKGLSRLRIVQTTEKFDCSKVQTALGMFKDCPSLEVVPLSSFKFYDDVDVTGIFAGSYRLDSLELSKWANKLQWNTR